MLLSTQVGLSPGDIVRWGPLRRGTAASHFLPHVYCGEKAGRIKMPFGTEVGLGPGTLRYMGTQLRPHKGHSSPQFSARVYCGHLAGCINMPPGTELGLSAGDTVLDDTYR